MRLLSHLTCCYFQEGKPSSVTNADVIIDYYCMKIKYIFLRCMAIAFSLTCYTQAFIYTKNTGTDFPVVAASQTTSMIKTTSHSTNKNGKHIIKYRMISPAVILQKIVLHFDDLKPSYLGAEETIFNSKNN